MDEKTDDAISAAFREMAEADPEYSAKSEGGRSYCNDCMGIDWGDGSKHAPDCPWLRRKQARERAEQKVREAIGQYISDLEPAAEYMYQVASFSSERDSRFYQQAIKANDALAGLETLAALKGAPTK